MHSNDVRRRLRRRSSATVGLALTLVLAVAAAAQGSTQSRPAADVHGTQAFWANAARPAPVRGVRTAVHATRFRPLTLDVTACARSSRGRPVRGPAAAIPSSSPCPRPTGRSTASRSRSRRSWRPASPGAIPRSRPTAAGRHRPSATIHADLSPLGFHASVRSATGVWYIDPYYVGRTPGRLRELLGRTREADAASTARDRSAERALCRDGPRPVTSSAPTGSR